MELPLTRIAFPSYTENVPDLIHKGNQIRSYSQRKSDQFGLASIGFRS
jgi:hypothetical protein